MTENSAQHKLTDYLLAALLPLLAVLYPIVFTYANNVSILTMASLWRILEIFAAISLLVYLIWVLVLKKKPFSAALAALCFVLLFLTYGSIYQLLIKIDLLPVYHFSLLPAAVILGGYLGWLVSKIPAEAGKKVWLILTSMAAILLVLNFVKIVPAELQKKSQAANGSTASAAAPAKPAAGAQVYPDIYWLIFDEFSGFDVASDYFNYPEIDQFSEHLQQMGFQVVEGSHSSSYLTLHQIATRLNYEQLPADLDELAYYQKISDNKVMHLLKSKGYTTVVMDEARSASFAFQAKTAIQADILLEDTLVSGQAAPEMVFNPFSLLVAERTMLLPFTQNYDIENVDLEKHRDTVYFVADELGKLDLPQPKFVYSHLLLPHMPFMFAENGSYLQPSAYHDWNYYFGQYQFTLKIIDRTVQTIMEAADPDNPPIIILQSDHGARNLGDNGNGERSLINYPDIYRTSILYAVYAPACPNMPLTDGIDPVNTFPLVFNCLFDSNIPLQ